MQQVKNAALILCLFVVLLVIFSSYFRASAVGTLLGALAGTPLLVHVFNRLVANRKTSQAETCMAPAVPHTEPLQRSTEQVVVLRLERPNER